MLNFSKKLPHPDLRKHIRNYWILECGPTTEYIRLCVPDGYPELFFTLSASFSMPHFSGDKDWTQQHTGGLIGQASEQFSFIMAPFSKVLFVKCYPWAPFYLFNLLATDIKDIAIDLSDILPKSEYGPLRERLHEAADLHVMAHILDAFLLAKLHNAKETVNSFLTYSVQQIFHSNGTIGMDTLTQQIRASRRYVELLYKNTVGMSPKQYAQIIRVKKASMYLLDPRYKGNIREIADRLDYYDQSHLLKDFKAVMGHSPSTFLQRQLGFSDQSLIEYLDQWDYS